LPLLKHHVSLRCQLKLEGLVAFNDQQESVQDYTLSTSLLGDSGAVSAAAIQQDKGNNHMTSWRAVIKRAVLAVMLCGCLAPGRADAQKTGEDVQLKEVQIATGAFSLGDQTPAWVAPVAIPETKQTQSIVLRLADTQYLIGGTPVVYVHRALMINDTASLSGAGQISIPFVPQYHKLKLHAVRVIRNGESLDRTTSSTVRFLQRETGLEHGVYSGEVTASVLVNDLRVGDTLEFAYSLHGDNPVFAGKFAETASWDQAFPTALRRIVLNHPVGRQISWRAIGDWQSRPVVPRETIRDGMRQLVLEERSIGKVEVERLTPPDYPAYRQVQFSEYSGWDDVVAWASRLFQHQGDLSQDIRDLVEKLREKPTDEDRIVGALEFVQSEIRYFSVSLGESSHRPTQPDVVIKQRYGDCKDKSLLLMTLLEALGIQSRPVLLTSGVHRGLDQALPSPQLFNHAIVQVTVNGKVFYLDPTLLGQHGRLERMGQNHEGAQVLVVAPQNRQLSTIASANVRDLVRNEMAETVTLHKLNGDAQLQIRQVWRGAMAEGLRILQQRVQPEQLMKSVSDLETRYPGARLVGEPNLQDDRINNVFSMTAQYSVSKLLGERGSFWFVRFSPGNMIGVLAPAPSPTRTTPLQLPEFPYDARYTFEIKFPDEVSVIGDSRANTVGNKYFNFTVRTASRGGNSKTVMQLATFADRVEVSDLKKYADDMRALSNVATGVVVIPKAAIRSVKFAPAAKKDPAKIVRDQLQETIDKATQAIKSGRLAGADLAGSYCLRSSARSDLGMAEDALADANEAVKLMPNSSDSLGCRAYAYFDAGEFEKTIADYSKSIALGATEARVLQQRGIAKFYAGRLVEAAEDLAKASNAGDIESQVYSDLWLSWTYQRLGQPLPEAMLARAGADPRGDWPRPALAVLAGKLSPEEMLKLLERKSGDERRTDSLEGYFNLGQYYFGRGDKTKAREFFEKTRQLNMVNRIEHKAAGFELRLLGAAAGLLAPEPVTGSLPAAGGAADAQQTNLPAVDPAPPKAKATSQKAPRKTPGWTSGFWKLW
jgi:lipoprotein NlpI/transglutaminase-like putative cysteine protease